MTLNDHEPPEQRFLVNSVRFSAVTHILRVNCAEMAGDGLEQPAYDIFSIECTFLRIYVLIF